QASGVAISDEVVLAYNQIKIRRQGDDEKERYKLVMFCISENGKNIVINHDLSLKNKHIENEENVFKKIASMIPLKDCCYGLYDCNYATTESQKQTLIFIMSAPDNAPLKKKMLYASSKAALKQKLEGVSTEWQVNDCSDMEMAVLVDKLSGTKEKVISLEGKKV
ncbi:non-muscle cofilin 1, partial [Silurus meridionalis]